jgi:hypothetical protein
LDDPDGGAALHAFRAWKDLCFGYGKRRSSGGRNAGADSAGRIPRQKGEDLLLPERKESKEKSTF